MSLVSRFVRSGDEVPKQEHGAHADRNECGRKGGSD
jgi:hypothetical protein